MMYEGQNLRELPAEQRAHRRIGYRSFLFDMFSVLKRMLVRRGGDSPDGQQPLVIARALVRALTDGLARAHLTV